MYISPRVKYSTCSLLKHSHEIFSPSFRDGFMLDQIHSPRGHHDVEQIVGHIGEPDAAPRCMHGYAPSDHHRQQHSSAFKCCTQSFRAPESNHSRKNSHLAQT